MGLNLIHLANFNSTNIGNGALAVGLENVINTDLDSKITWHHEAWDDYTFGLKHFDQAFVKKINKSDGLVVGGAVTFNGRAYNDKTGTRFELPFEMWEEIRKPVVFYGLSYRHWPGADYHHIDKLKQFVERVLAHDLMLLAVRNDGTKAWLEKITGITSDLIIEIPDSAVFVNASEHAYTEIVTGKKNILVAFNDEDSALRYRCGENNKRQEVIETVAYVFEELSRCYPLNIILCPHYHDDYAMMADFMKFLKPRLAHQDTVTAGLNRIMETSFFYGRYQKVDLALSMRVHSMSPCIGLGVPMIALTTQDRMTKFMQDVNLGCYAVDILETGVAREILAKADSILDDSEEVKQAFKVAREELRFRIMEFNKLVQTHLGKS